GGGEPPSERLCAGTPARPAQRSGDGGSPPPPYSTSGARRSAFFALSARFAASSFSFARRERRRFWRRMRARSAAAASATPRARASSLSSSSRRARKRLRACERSRWHLTITPLGRWRSTTQVDTLLTFCPPFPPERTKCSSRSASRTPSTRMRAARACCFSGETGNTRAGLPSAPSAGHRRGDPTFERGRHRLPRAGCGTFRALGRGASSRRTADLLASSAATAAPSAGVEKEGARWPHRSSNARHRVPHSPSPSRQALSSAAYRPQSSRFVAGFRDRSHRVDGERDGEKQYARAPLPLGSTRARGSGASAYRPPPWCPLHRTRIDASSIEWLRAKPSRGRAAEMRVWCLRRAQPTQDLGQASRAVAPLAVAISGVKCPRDRTTHHHHPQ